MKPAGAPYDIVIAGRGGQGVLYLSRILGEAALVQGLAVRTTETHGMAMRGGSVLCFVRIGSALGPLFPRGSADLLMVLHPAEAATGHPYLGPGGVVVFNGASGSLPEFLRVREGVFPVDAESMARSVGNPRGANLALVGAAASLLRDFPLAPPSIEEAIVSQGPERFRTTNLEVFRLGQSGTGKD